MGWIRGVAPVKLEIRKAQEVAEGLANAKQKIEHVKQVGSTSKDRSCAQQQDTLISDKEYPFQTTEELPFIPPEIVVSKRRPGALLGKADNVELCKDRWIVIDEIVYDCSEFTAEHPGGEQVILSFVGEDCSWQFWRFHGKNEMEQYARGLRIGRTKGIVNRFIEPVRFVGLSKFGNDDW